MALLFPSIRGAFFRQVLTALVGLCVFSAQAQWQWLDKDGRRMFSDRPPPTEVPEKSILQRPGRPALSPTAAAAQAAPTPDSTAQAVQIATTKPSGGAGAVAQGNIPKLPAAETELEKKKKAAVDQEAARRKAEEEKFALARAENCSRAQADKRTLDSGVRLSRTNDKGEREIFDEKIRAEESERLLGVMKSDCK